MQTPPETKQRQPAHLLRPLALLTVLVITALTLTVSQLLTIHLDHIYHNSNVTTSNMTTSNMTISPNNTKSKSNNPVIKDLFFTPTIPTHVINATHPRSPPCIIFSCADHGYFLVEPHLHYHGAKFCDRHHFTGRTTDQNGNTQPAVWCRVALFRIMSQLFQPYKTVIYTDVDIVYDEHNLLHLQCGTGLKSVIVSTKIEKGITVLRIPWIVLCDRHDHKVIQMIETWSRKHREVYLRDQTVFNENWRCTDVTCYNRTIAHKAEIRHCGSWLPRQQRLECFDTS